jgi:hypothetical protein
MRVTITITIQMIPELVDDFTNVIQIDEKNAFNINDVFYIYNYDNNPHLFTINIVASSICNFAPANYKFLDFLKQHKIKYSKIYNYKYNLCGC